jgi:glycosyltransferase involved in cell wall biosynthesis
MADIVVLSSIEKEVLDISGEYLSIKGNEGFPRVILEAMSCGKPVIGTYIAGVPELIEDGVNGFLVPPGDAKSLANALVKMITTPELRARMGMKSREKVLEFTPQSVMPKIVTAYQDLLR